MRIKKIAQVDVPIRDGDTTNYDMFFSQLMRVDYVPVLNPILNEQYIYMITRDPDRLMPWSISARNTNNDVTTTFHGRYSTKEEAANGAINLVRDYFYAAQDAVEKEKAERSILEKLRAMKTFDATDEDNYPKIMEALDKAGIVAVVNPENNEKKTYELFYDSGKQWKAYIHFYAVPKESIQNLGGSHKTKESAIESIIEDIRSKYLIQEKPIQKEIPLAPSPVSKRVKEKQFMSAEDLANLLGNKKPDMIKLAAQVPANRMPTNNTVYVWAARITDTETISPRTGQRANKEYIVRVYRYLDSTRPGDSLYGIISFYGRTGGTLSMDWKGTISNRNNAIRIADRLIRLKTDDPAKHYRRELSADGEGLAYTRRIPGTYNPVETPSSQQITQPQNIISVPTPRRIPRPQDIPGPEDIPEDIPEVSKKQIDEMPYEDNVLELIDKFLENPTEPHEFGIYTYLITKQRNLNAEPGYIAYEYHTSGDIPIMIRPYEMALRRNWFRNVDDAISQIWAWASQWGSISEPAPTPEPEKTAPSPISEDLKKKLQNKGLTSEEDLASLLGKNNNWYKTSESLYTEEIAKTTTDPQILTDILRRENNDRASSYVAGYAAENPNCPPEILAEVLRRGKDDRASTYAAENPNCPPEVLAEVLRRGKDDFVSLFAAKNPNCPPEVLAEVILRRDKSDPVSERAAENLERRFTKEEIDGFMNRRFIFSPISEDLKKKLQDKGLTSEEDIASLLGENKSWYKRAKK